MKNRLYTLFVLLMVAALTLSACGPKTEAPVVEPTQPVMTEEAMATEEPAEADLDAAFTRLLSTMQAYNTMKADELLAAMVEDTPPFILDVRTTEEVEKNGHIEGAYHIPLTELGKNLDKLPSFDTPIVVYCGSGWRATIAMTALSALGWEDVKALKVAFADWKDAGNPVVEGLPEPAPVLNAANPDPALVAAIDAMLSNVPQGYGVLKAEDLNLALVENPDMILIDVRTDGERQEKGIIDSGDIPQIQIPLEDFIARMSEWPADKNAEIVVYCGSGHRSTMAMTILWSYGYTNVKSLAGGFGGWVSAGFPVAEYAQP
jgi:rhodanese-related sulfurtransferase/predicted small lipoprotein YifL